MTGRVTMSPSLRNVLTTRNTNQAEKENSQESSIIVRARADRIRDSSDSDSDSWSIVEKKKKGSAVPHYVTREDGLQQRKRSKMSSPTPVSLPSHVIARRNERERNRVRQVNESFAVLRSHIPEYLYESEALEGTKNRKKLSKVETLRLAVHYIQRLEHLLDIKDTGSSDDDQMVQFFDSESQMSSRKTDPDSELDSDIMDLSNDPRRGSPPSETESHGRIKSKEGFLLKYEDQFEVKEEEGSLSPYSPRCESPAPPGNTVHLPSISTFPSKGLSLGYPDLY